MILIGYDPKYNHTYACYAATMIRFHDSPRAHAVINGLINVSDPIEVPDTIDETDFEGLLNSFLFRHDWQYRVEYSDQAWNDILDCGDIL